jgi:hypothetical protein
MKNKTTRDIGRKLEEYVLAKVKEIDPQARLSRGSGCGNDIGDITSNILYCECKKRNTESISIKESVWLHLVNKLPINTEKISIMALENKNNKRFIVLELEDFFKILKENNEL